MPYIEKSARDEVFREGPDIDHPGDVNFQITLWLTQAGDPGLFRMRLSKLFNDMWDRRPKYSTANMLYGATVLALREYRRRFGRDSDFALVAVDVLEDFYFNILGPYEDTKIEQNGDIDAYWYARQA